MLSGAFQLMRNLSTSRIAFLIARYSSTNNSWVDQIFLSLALNQTHWFFHDSRFNSSSRFLSMVEIFLHTYRVLSINMGIGIKDASVTANTSTFRQVIYAPQVVNIRSQYERKSYAQTQRSWRKPRKKCYHSFFHLWSVITREELASVSEGKNTSHITKSNRWKYYCCVSAYFGSL